MTRILIVEDEKRISQFIAKGLRRQGMTTEVVGDGAEAIARLEQEPFEFDGMLLDLGLPNLDGWAVLKRLQERGAGEGCAMPVIIVMTALSDERQLENALALGASAYIRKPFQFGTLLKILAQVLPGDSP